MTIRDTLKWVDSHRSDVPTLTPQGLADLLTQAPEEITLIDIRELQERLLRGAIPGGHSAPRGMLEFWADPNCDYFRDFFREDTHLVVYCAGGARSVLAARSLMEMGYRHVSHLDEGFAGWTRAGFEVEDVSASSKWVQRDDGLSV